MKQINLLPWRETEKEERKQHFFWLLGLSAGLIIICVIIVHLYMDTEINSQQFRVDFLTQQQVSLDSQLAQIKNLQTQKQQVLQRMALIQSLQENRPEIVHIFNELAQITPDGVYLTSVKRTDNEMDVSGKAQSNTRVSLFMKNIEASKWLGPTSLTEIDSDATGGAYSNTFALKITLSNDGKSATNTASSAIGGSAATMPPSTTSLPSIDPTQKTN